MGTPRYERCRNIHDSGIEKLRVIITSDIDTQISRVLENFEHWREYPNFENIWKLWKFWAHLVHWRQYSNLRVREGEDNVTKCAQNFQNFRVSDHEYPNFGYYGTPHRMRLSTSVFDANSNCYSRQIEMYKWTLCWSIPKRFNPTTGPTRIR